MMKLLELIYTSKKAFLYDILYLIITGIMALEILTVVIIIIKPF